MRYIGGKSLLLQEILNAVTTYTTKVTSVIDVFAGSGVVSGFLKEHQYQVISNDFLYFSYVLNRGTLCLNQIPSFQKLEIKDPLAYLNALTKEEACIESKDCFICRNYSPNEAGGRMYFQPENASKIDVIRITIERWYESGSINEDEYFYLLAVLLSAVPYVSNIAGVYGAYLKTWDARAFHPLTLKALPVTSSSLKAEVYHLDYVQILKQKQADLLYADPPYNTRQYLPNYHVLETIARYDYPKIKGVTGMREYDSQKSDFCMKTKVEDAFVKLIREARVRYILISYNNEGLLSTNRIKEIMQTYGKKDTFRLMEMDYRRYKSKIPNHGFGLKEQLYFIEKDRTHEAF